MLEINQCFIPSVSLLYNVHANYLTHTSSSNSLESLGNNMQKSLEQVHCITGSQYLVTFFPSSLPEEVKITCAKWYQRQGDYSYGHGNRMAFLLNVPSSSPWTSTGRLWIQCNILFETLLGKGSQDEVQPETVALTYLAPRANIYSFLVLDPKGNFY